MNSGAINRFSWMWKNFEFTNDEVCYQKTTLNFVDSVWEIFGPLLKGIPLVIANNNAIKNPKLLLKDMKIRKISRLVLVPSLLDVFLKLYYNDLKDLTHLKILVVSGETLKSDLAQAFKECLPNTILLNLYGSTEVSGDVTFHQVSSIDTKRKYSVIGKPLQNNKVHILNDFLQPVPVGYTGFICASGINLSRGYLNKDLTEKYFKNVNLFNEQHRIYLTGDRGRLLPNGEIEYIGRMDSQVKIRGVRIELNEIEIGLQSIDMINQSKVIAIENETGKYRLEAFVVLDENVEKKGNNSKHIRSIITKLDFKLPSFMIPERVHIIDKMPQTPSGKIDKISLTAISAEKTTSLLNDESSNLSKDKQQNFHIIWSKYLGISSFEKHLTPFNYGANSLMLIEIQNAIKKELSAELSITDLGDTFENQFRLINENSGKLDDDDSIIQSGENQTVIPANILEQQMYFLEENLAIKGVYNIVYKCEFSSMIDVDLLVKSINYLVKINPNLICNFKLDSTKTLRKYLTERQLNIKIFNENVDEEMLVNELLSYQFSLSKSDLFVVYILLRKTSCKILLCAHHIIMDGISFKNFFFDLSKIYSIYHSKEEVRMSVDYPKYFKDQSLNMQQLDFLKKEIQSIPSVLHLYGSKVRKSRFEIKGEFMYSEFDKSLLDELKIICEKNNTTFFIGLLSLFGLLLSRYSIEKKFAIGIPMSTRKHGSVEKSFGFFINMVPFIFDLESVTNAGDYLKRVTQSFFKKLDIAHIPLQNVLSELQIERKSLHDLLFQIVFSYEKVDYSQIDFPNETRAIIEEIPSIGAKYDLSFVIREKPEKTQLFIEYSTDKYDVEFIKQMKNDYLKIIENFIKINKTKSVDFYKSIYRECPKEIASFQSIDFWMNNLEDRPETTEFPIDFNRPLIKSYKTNLFSMQISSIDSLFKEYCEQTNSTPFAVLLSAYVVLIYRYTYQKDILLGFPTNLNEDLVNNIVMLRVKMSNNTNFLDLLNEVIKSVSNIIEHKNVPFELLLEKLNVKKDLSRSALFQLMFSYESEVGNSSPYDIHLKVKQTEGSLILNIEYDTDLFRNETIVTLAKNYKFLFESILKNKSNNNSILELNMLEPKEREFYLNERCGNQLIRDDNKIKKSIVNYVHKMFESSAESYPNKIAVSHKDETITYQELNERSNELASYLKENTKIQNIVGISLDRSIDLIISIIAVLKSGCTYLPLDPHYPNDRLDYMLDDSKSSLIITSKNYTEKYSSFNGKVVVLDEFKEISNKYSNRNPKVDLKPDYLQYIIYTSGSTGKPKGVMVTHFNAFNLFYNIESIFDFNSDDAWTLFHSYSFDVSVWEIWGALISGAKLVVVPYRVSRSPEEFYNLMIKENVTVLCQTPPAFQQIIVLENNFNDVKKSIYTGLRYVYLGGEKLPPEILIPWFNKHGDVEPKLINSYGPTECTVNTSYFPVAKEYLLRKKSIIGYPFPNTKVYILDKNMQPVPNNVVGEIYIGGKAVALGYLNRTELTNARFIQNQFDVEIQNSRLYKSGDLGRYLYDGTIEFLGRIDHQVKINGFRVELGEIESAIHTSQIVEEVLVVPYGLNNNQRLVAYIVLKNRQVPIEENEKDKVTKILFKQIKEFLPKFMMPSSYMYLEQFKKNENNKIDRKALPEPNYFYFEKEEDRIIVMPKTDLEKTVASLLSQLLKIKVEDISMTDNVFNVGINSVLVIQFVHEMSNHFKKVKVNIRDVYEDPTIERLCLNIQNKVDLNNGKMFFIIIKKPCFGKLLDKTIGPLY